MLIDICFWVLVAFVAYTYAGYPMLLALLGRVRARPIRKDGGKTPSVSFVLAAYNEENTLRRRLQELTNMVVAAGVEGEFIVVSDGSTDGTAAVARSFAKEGVRLVEMQTNGGKAAALTRGCQAARNEVLVFADARQTWAPDALTQLLRPFNDLSVGAVSGDLAIESAPGVLAGVGLYWRYEKWVRRAESQLHSTVGVTGAISAVRRRLFHPIPAGTLLDDVFWPLHLTLQGFRVVHEQQAKAFDRLPDRVRSEFRRKVRTLTGNFQLITLVPAALLPWRNPVWLQFLSHKVFRLFVPWALLALLALNLILSGSLYEVTLTAQLLFYALAATGCSTVVAGRFRLASAATSFVILNAAAWLAFWNWSLGHSARSWVKVDYQLKPPGHVLLSLPVAEPAARVMEIHNARASRSDADPPTERRVNLPALSPPPKMPN